MSESADPKQRLTSIFPNVGQNLEPKWSGANGPSGYFALPIASPDSSMKTNSPTSIHLAFSKRIGAALFCLIVCGGALASPQEHYSITDLPSLGGTISRGNSINNRGWAAGYSNLAG